MVFKRIVLVVLACISFRRDQGIVVCINGARVIYSLTVFRTQGLLNYFCSSLETHVPRLCMVFMVVSITNMFYNCLYQVYSCPSPLPQSSHSHPMIHRKGPVHVATKMAFCGWGPLLCDGEIGSISWPNNSWVRLSFILLYLILLYN